MAVLSNNYSAAVGTRLTIPTHVSPAGGQIAHPSVIRIGAGFGGYRYWMAATPYPASNDAHEDPNILASGNGSNWVVPPGLTNPLDNAAGGTIHNSDTNLEYDSATETLYCFWRQVNKGSTTNRETLFYRTSTDGVTWTARQTAFVFAAPATGSRMLAPQLIKSGPDWYLYAVDTTAGNRVVMYRTTTLETASWTAPAYATISGLPAGARPWHIGLKLVNDMGTSKMVALLDCAMASGSYQLYMMVGGAIGSLSFTAHNKPLVPTIGVWHDNVYQSDFIASSDSVGNVSFDIWYSGWDKKKNVWNILRTKAAPIRDTIPPTAPSALTATMRPEGVRLAWAASFDNKGVTGYEIRRDNKVIANVGKPGFTDVTALLGKTYSYTVLALDGNKNKSALSTPAIISTPTPPTVAPTESAGPVDGSPMGRVPTVRVLGRGVLGPGGNVESIQVTEDASPVAFTDSSPGVGGFTVVAEAYPGVGGTDSLRGEIVDIYDPRAGVQRGVVDSVRTTDEFSVNVEASSELVKTVVTRTMAPFTGTLGGALRYYLGACGVTGGIDVEPWIEGTLVDLPFWRGDVWTQLKKLMALYQFELAYIAGSITARRLRTRVVDTGYVSSMERTLPRTGGAMLVKVAYYENQWATGRTMYPLADQNILDRQIIQVDAGEEVTQNVPVSAWVSSVIQPKHVMNLDEALEDGTSAYSVVDKEGISVSPSDWRNGGGSLVYAIGDDGQSVDVIVRGMSTSQRAPYRIASTSHDTTYQYSSFSIAGNGVFFTRNEVALQTGAPVEAGPIDDETTIDDPLVSTVAQAWAVAMQAAIHQSGALQQITISTPHVTRSTVDGLTMYPTFAEYNAILGNKTIAQFNTEIGNKTIAQFNKDLAQIKAGSFENQAFGGMAGARYWHQGAVYRLTRVSVSTDEFSWDGEDDFLVSDFNAAYGNLTFAEFNARLGDRTVSEFGIAPLSV